MDTTQQTPPEHETAPQKKKTGGKNAIIALVIIAILCGLAYFFIMHKTPKEEPVATVDGTPITKAEYNESLEMLTKNSPVTDSTDEAMKENLKNQALDILINNTLLLNGAKSKGVTATDEEVNTEYNKLKDELGGADELQKKMTEVGLTEEKLRSNIKERIVVDKYLAAETDIDEVAATDEEVKAFYDSLTANGSTMPPLDDIKDQVVAQIEGQKRQAIVNDFLAKLRSEAKIDIKI